LPATFNETSNQNCHDLQPVAMNRRSIRVGVKPSEAIAMLQATMPSEGREDSVENVAQTWAVVAVGRS
jgi:hypothetical protein